MTLRAFSADYISTELQFHAENQSYKLPLTAVVEGRVFQCGGAVCPEGEYCQDGQLGSCNNCSNPTVANCLTVPYCTSPSRPFCHHCVVGYYAAADGSCQRCSVENCHTCSAGSPSMCEDCSDGYELTDEGSEVSGGRHPVLHLTPRCSAHWPPC